MPSARQALQWLLLLLLPALDGLSPEHLSCWGQGEWQPLPPGGPPRLFEFPPEGDRLQLRLRVPAHQWLLFQADVVPGDADLEGLQMTADFGVDACPPLHGGPLRVAGSTVRQVVGGAAPRVVFITYAPTAPDEAEAFDQAGTDPPPAEAARHRTWWSWAKKISEFGATTYTAPMVNISVVELLTHHLSVPLTGPAQWTQPLHVTSDAVLLFQVTSLAAASHPDEAEGPLAKLTLGASGPQSVFAGRGTVMLSRPYLQSGFLPLCGPTTLFVALHNPDRTSFKVTLSVRRAPPPAPAVFNVSGPYEGVALVLPRGEGDPDRLLLARLAGLDCVGCSVHAFGKDTHLPVPDLQLQVLANPASQCPLDVEFWESHWGHGELAGCAGFVTANTSIITLAFLWSYGGDPDWDGTVTVLFRKPVPAPVDRAFIVPLFNRHDADAALLIAPLPAPHRPRGVTVSVAVADPQALLGVWVRCGAARMNHTDPRLLIVSPVINGTHVYTTCQAGEAVLYVGLTWTPRPTSMSRAAPFALRPSRPLPAPPHPAPLPVRLEVRLGPRACLPVQDPRCAVDYTTPPFLQPYKDPGNESITLPILCEAQHLRCDPHGLPVPLCISACQASARCCSGSEAATVRRSAGCRLARAAHCTHHDPCRAPGGRRGSGQDHVGALYTGLFSTITVLVGAMGLFFLTEDLLVARQLSAFLTAAPCQGADFPS